ncbi:MAG: Ig-like domain-containing protein, partial [Candidatus Paceibacteria bacterium]
NQWEPPVKEWAKDNGFKNLKTPPTEEDTIYDDGKSPSIQVTNLSDGFNIKGNQTSSFKVKTSLSAERDIKKVEFLIDESVVKTVTSSPYNANLSVPGKGGAHTLTVRVVDKYFEKGKTTLNFNVEKDEEAPRILDFQASDGPEKYTLKAKVREENDGSGLEKIE